MTNTFTNKQTKFSLIGDKAFYRRLFVVALPIMMQNGITNFVSLLDNIMVGRLGTEQMSGVSIVNQLIFIFYLCLFGAIGGTGIFTAQYYGQRNDDGIRITFRFKMVLGLVIVGIFALLFMGMDDQLISLYLHDGSADGNLEATLNYGKRYLHIMLISLIPSALEQVYSSTLRECEKTVVPMVASISAVFINLGFNYILIFGHFGAPALGVEGAAIATVISKFIQVGMLIIWSHTHTNIYTYIAGVYKGFKIPFDVAKRMIIMALPLIANETLWASGMATLTQIYSIRGLSVVAAMNIQSTIYNVFNIAFIAMGDAVAIIVGQYLGAGEYEEGKQTAYRIIAFSTVMCVGIGAILFIVAPFFPMIYNTSEEVRTLATGVIRMAAIVMPVNGFLHSTYFTIRSGGKTFITFLFDSVFLWVITVPIAYALINYTALSVVIIFFFAEMTNAIKSFIGWLIIKSGVWMQNIVDN